MACESNPASCACAATGGAGGAAEGWALRETMPAVCVLPHVKGTMPAVCVLQQVGLEVLQEDGL